MADEQDKWLDRETAELLLRGQSPQGVEPAARERAERLAAALVALSAPAAPTGEELPGEAAALAAFRKVRAERDDASAGASAGSGRDAAARHPDTGLVRIGPRGDGARRPRRSRPLRLGLAAALTVGMVGSVAVAAGTGVLPTPFHRTEPEPAATVSAAVSPDRLLVSPSPSADARGGSAPRGAAPDAPDESTGGESGRAGNRDAEDRDTGGTDGRRSALTASCRKVRAGQELDGPHRRALKEAAGGSSRVGKYCGDLLTGTGTGTGGPGATTREGGLRLDTGDGEGGDGRNGQGGKGPGDKGSKGDQGGKEDGGGKGGKVGKGDKDGGGKEGDDGHAGQGNHGGGDNGDGDGDNGDDDDDSDIAQDMAPPARDPHRPHRPPRSHAPRSSSALTPRTQPRSSASAPHPPLSVAPS
ncbi:hypothetical protein ABZ038_04185 [Streptomyces sp. NPDC006349]|uniref:hypothetical protein n=1 Tax=Streptomyces sp. NPDC006349 TaxID=3156757 RepID=UPI00339DB691